MVTHGYQVPDSATAESILPKAELHVHIEGTLEPALAFRLAARNGIELPYAGPAALKAAYEFTSLRSFLDVYYRITAVLRHAEDFAELADAYLRKAAEQGVRRAEIFFDPQAHTSRGVPAHAVMEGLGTSLADSEKRFGISTALILCFHRDRGADAAMSCLREFLPYRSRFIGVGLDSAELGYPPGDFRAVFDAAAREGLHRVAHAGEEGPPEYVWAALDELGVERIDHGVRSLEDPALVARLRSDAIPLTVCPMSNIKLKVYRSWAQVPVAHMLDNGLVVTINSDDPAYFGGYIEDNYRALRDELGISSSALRVIAENSFNASFMKEEEKSSFIAGLPDPG